MPREIIYWTWEEAFDKFGFDDGDGLVMTYRVASALESAGYAVGYDAWGMHNTIIRSIKKDGVELIPDSAELGYDDPRQYLPADIVQHLDDTFNDEED
jgi:hypothetical protein